MSNNRYSTEKLLNTLRAQQINKANTLYGPKRLSILAINSSVWTQF